jgi:hypothetical protein
MDGLVARAQRGAHGEVRVGGDDDHVLCFGVSGDLGVGRRRKAHVDDVNGVVAVVAEGLGDALGQVGVDQQPYAGRTKGTSRWSTTAAAYSRAARTSSPSG